MNRLLNIFRREKEWPSMLQTDSGLTDPPPPKDLARQDPIAPLATHAMPPQVLPSVHFTSMKDRRFVSKLPSAEPEAISKARQQQVRARLGIPEDGEKEYWAAKKE